MCDLTSWAHIWCVSGFVLKTGCYNLYLNNYAFDDGRKNIPMCILIRYRFNRVLLFIVSINLYYRSDGHHKINYKSIQHK
jgi:hypothetical protein